MQLKIATNMELVRQSSEDSKLEGIDLTAAEAEFPEIALRKYNREIRMTKVRERIRSQKEAREEDEKRKEEVKLEQERSSSKLDKSKTARRLRAYTCYSQMGMPSLKVMKARVALMPPSTRLTAEDVGLLPWTYNGKRVDVAKMQDFITAGSKRSTRKKLDSDSYSDQLPRQEEPKIEGIKRSTRKKLDLDSYSDQLPRQEEPKIEGIKRSTRKKLDLDSYSDRKSRGSKLQI
jgi:hypothetical protein